MWDWNGASWWSWLLMSGGMLLFWGFIAWAVGQAIRWSSSSNPPTAVNPEATLAERFARGDIDADEYRARLDVLRKQRPAA